jgi:hypothetical protein
VRSDRIAPIVDTTTAAAAALTEAALLYNVHSGHGDGPGLLATVGAFFTVPLVFAYAPSAVYGWTRDRCPDAAELARIDAEQQRRDQEARDLAWQRRTSTDPRLELSRRPRRHVHLPVIATSCV